MFHLLGHALCGATLLASVTAKGVYEPLHHHHESRNLEARQAVPATTTSTNCPDNDGLFYATTHNYTYQIQCATSYTGGEIMTQGALGFTACILQCASYNHNNSSSSSFCVGVNFEAATDDGDGDCVLFDEVSPTPDQASQEGSVADAALLIYGPTGQVFATPEQQPSNVVGGILTNSPVYTSQPAVSTALSTSGFTVISCAPGISNCPANGLPTSTLHRSSSSVTLANASPSISISLGGMRPLTGSMPSGSVSNTASSTRSTPTATTVLFSPQSGSPQATQISTVPYTEYRVITVVSCAQEPSTTSCATSVSTETIAGLRTEISCSPGTCTGLVIASETSTGISGIYTGACIVAGAS